MRLLPGWAIILANRPNALHNAQQIRIIIVYTIALIRYPRVALPRQPGFFEAVFWSVIMELLLSLLVGCGISLILFYRK
ncbi:hypothetical protein [Cupriavidus sp. RAF12]|uniref:hypothetical protein n=1 Tax=Cupriavidus sp. RAF12 TaxID=3233050 RepID=UPI003F900339